MTAVQQHPSINVQIWNLMLDAERQYRYFSEKANRYRIRSRWINILMFTASLMTAFYLFVNYSNLASIITVAGSFLAFIIVAGLTAEGMFLQTSKNTGVAESVSKQCQLISMEAKRLWRRLGEPVRDVNLVVMANELEFRLNIVTQVELDLDDDLNKKCEQEARKVLEDEFANA